MASKPGPDEVPTALQDRRARLHEGTVYGLTVVEGPDRGFYLRLDVTLPARVLVGQSPSCVVRLTDPRVSRRHLAIDLGGPRLRVTDLGSTNGTSINGVSMVEALVGGGEVIRIGDSALRVDAVVDAEPPRLGAATRFGRLVGGSLEMQRLYRICEQLAASTVPVLIEGETGTGKEVLAESIHESGPRAGGPFVVFDCTAVPPNLVESELFGHERGSFTGAVATRAGLFEQAHGGTLLIDEIGDLDRALQPKLLRALERLEVRRVGGTEWLKVDVRVIGATRRDLDREVQLGNFRDDLFYRLAVARVELPPLRDRRGDIGLLTREFWRVLGGQGDVPHDLIDRFERCPWPGNVRELHNAVARQLALGEAFEGPASSVPRGPSGSDAVQEILDLGLPFPRARDQLLAHFEKRYVERVLADNGGVVSRAALASGIARRYFNLIKARNRLP